MYYETEDNNKGFDKENSSETCITVGDFKKV